MMLILKLFLCWECLCIYINKQSLIVMSGHTHKQKVCELLENMMNKKMVWGLKIGE